MLRITSCRTVALRLVPGRGRPGARGAAAAVRLRWSGPMPKEQFENDFPSLEKLPDRGEEEVWDYLEELYENMRQTRR